MNTFGLKRKVHTFGLGWYVTEIIPKSFRKKISMVFRFNRVIHI